jgi:hypothetical protein
MKAAVFHAPNEPLTIEEVCIAMPGRSEVLIRTAYTGLRHSDLHFIEGKYPGPTPAVLGHECAGVVEAVGGLNCLHCYGISTCGDDGRRYRVPLTDSLFGIFPNDLHIR